MSSKKLEEYVGVRHIHSWKEFNDLCESLFNNIKDQWVFRGQQDSAWRLSSTLERKIEEFNLDKSNARHIERGLLRKFQRLCHHYISNTPELTDELEWLALMQHHFAPTRLLDWTYSPFVALYFAIEKTSRIIMENADPQCGDKYRCAVWAFNTSWMIDVFKDFLKYYRWAFACWSRDSQILQQQTVRKLFLRDEYPIAFVGAVTPQRLNQRINIQQGIFLCSGDVSKTFEENLINLLSHKKSEAKSNFIKITVTADPDDKKDILKHLHRVNINRATLFPGLDGFGESLGILMANHEYLLHHGYS